MNSSNGQNITSGSSYHSYFTGGGEMGELIRSFDWATSSLGTPDTWPACLLTTIGIMLNSRFAMFLFWGEKNIQFYNDAYRVSLGKNGMHPSALGSSGKESWGERWDSIKSRINYVLTTGEPTWSENEPIPMNRNNSTELTYWTYSYSQVKDESGVAAGTLVICQETTKEIENQQKVHNLNIQLNETNEKLADFNDELTVTNEELLEAERGMQMMIAELAHNESRFRLLVEQIPVAVNLFRGRELVIEFANSPMLELWGRIAEEVMGKPLTEAMPELKDQPFMKRLDDVLTSGVAYTSSSEQAFIMRNGELERCYFDIVYQPVVNENGTITSILQVATEVTKEIMASRQIQELNEELAATNEELSAINEELAVSNEELRSVNEEMLEIQDHLLNTNTLLTQSEEKLRLSNEAAGIGNWTIDAITGQMSSTRRYREIFGLDTNKETSLAEVASLVIEPYLQRTKEKGLAAMTEGKPYVNEYPFRRKSDGIMRWVRTIATPKRLPDGALVLFTGVTMDITEQVMAKKEIEESEERFRTMAEGTHILIAVGDESSKAIYFNTAWEDLTGRSRKDLLDFGWADLVHPEDKERYVNLYLSAFEKQEPFTGEFRILDKEGNYRWLLAQGRPRFRTDGSFAGYISSCIDINEQKRDDQRKNDFIGMVSHELKTPLTSLGVYIDLVKMRLADDQQKQNVSLLEKAARQVGKMTTMINGFLNVSRLESGKLQIDKSLFDLSVLLKEGEEETCSTIKSHYFVFHPVEVTFVNADRDKIGHVVNNLISNAVKYSQTGSTIQIACTNVNGYAQISVSDKGIGVANEDLDKLFERYYRGRNSNPQAVSGFGIGLYLCAEIIRRHDGKIWVESEEGKGSTFYFTLPLATP